MRIFRCKHRRLSLPLNQKRSCLDCSAVFPYEALTLTDTDREQAAAVEHVIDRSNIRNSKTAEVVRSITRKQVCQSEQRSKNYVSADS